MVLFGGKIWWVMAKDLERNRWKWSIVLIRRIWKIWHANVRRKFVLISSLGLPTPNAYYSTLCKGMILGSRPWMLMRIWHGPMRRCGTISCMISLAFGTTHRVRWSRNSLFVKSNQHDSMMMVFRQHIKCRIPSKNSFEKVLRKSSDLHENNTLKVPRIWSEKMCKSNKIYYRFLRWEPLFIPSPLKTSFSDFFFPSFCVARTMLEKVGDCRTLSSRQLRF